MRQSRTYRTPPHEEAMNEHRSMKVLIVLIVFPALVSIIFTFMALPAGLVLTPLFARAGVWSETLSNVFVGITLLIALVGSCALCRRFWPRSQDSDGPSRAA